MAAAASAARLARDEAAGRRREAALAACEACALESVHVVAHGLGGAAALRMVAMLRVQEAELRAMAGALAPAAPMARLEGL